MHPDGQEKTGNEDLLQNKNWQLTTLSKSSLPSYLVFRCCLLPMRVVTLYVLNVPERHCKNTTFPQTHKGMGRKAIYSTKIWLMFHFGTSSIGGYKPCISMKTPLFPSHKPTNHFIECYKTITLRGLRNWGKTEMFCFGLMTERFFGSQTNEWSNKRLFGWFQKQQPPH